MAARDLCTRADVTAYAPGYTSHAATDALLDRLVTGESRSIHERTGREFKAISPAVATRRFDIGATGALTRLVYIGDLSAAPSTVKIIDSDQTTEVETVTAANYVLWPRVRQEWEPIRALWFPPSSPDAASVTSDAVLEVNGTWGFPAVPDDIKEACAARVIFRYVTDATNAGTLLSESLAQVNVGALFANSEQVIQSYGDPLVA